jgi:hypothetical protein
MASFVKNYMPLAHAWIGTAARTQERTISQKHDLAPDKFWVSTLLTMADFAQMTPATPPIDSENEAVEPLDGLACVNCDEEVEEPRAYCSDFCLEFAGIVRSVRKATAENRLASDDYREGLGQKLLALFQGGYPARERYLTPAQRTAIFERDHWTCQICGKPADQIDHVASDSSEPLNLRAVCGHCNRERVLRGRQASADEQAEFQDRASQICAELALRIAATNVQRVCDDYEGWRALERQIRSQRTRRFKELQEEAETDFEDVDGYLYDAMQRED